MNTVALALYYKDMPAQLLASLESVNLVLTIAFTVELLLKLAGHGVAPFCGEPHNVFDALIVVTSLLEVVVSYSPHIDIGIPFSVPSTFEIIATPPRLRSWRIHPCAATTTGAAHVPSPPRHQARVIAVGTAAGAHVCTLDSATPALSASLDGSPPCGRS